jgi:hypothetical protein
MQAFPVPGKQVRAFREYDRKSGWRQSVPPAKPHESYDHEVVKRGLSGWPKPTDG